MVEKGAQSQVSDSYIRGYQNFVFLKPLGQEVPDTQPKTKQNVYSNLTKLKNYRNVEKGRKITKDEASFETTHRGQEFSEIYKVASNPISRSYREYMIQELGSIIFSIRQKKTLGLG